MSTTQTQANAATVAIKTFKVWREISIVPYTRMELWGLIVSRAKDIGARYHPYIGFDEGLLKVSPPRKVKLACISVEDLGFGEVFTSRQVEERALEMGLRLCPLETGPLIFLQLPPDDFKTSLWIHSEFSKNHYRLMFVGNGVLEMVHVDDCFDRKCSHPFDRDRHVFEIPDPVS